MSVEAAVVTIELLPWEYIHACDIGIKRYAANWDKENAAWYGDPDRLEDDRTATVAAAIVELAVAKYLNQFWHAHVWHSSEHYRYDMYPDIGKNIEARRIRVSDGVPIRAGQNSIAGLKVWAARPEPSEFRVVKIYGWVLQSDGWEKVGLPNMTQRIHEFFRWNS